MKVENGDEGEGGRSRSAVFGLTRKDDAMIGQLASDRPMECLAWPPAAATILGNLEGTATSPAFPDRYKASALQRRAFQSM